MSILSNCAETYSLDTTIPAAKPREIAPGAGPGGIQGVRTGLNPVPDAEAAFVQDRFYVRGKDAPCAGMQIMDLTRKRVIQLHCYVEAMDMEGQPGEDCP